MTPTASRKGRKPNNGPKCYVIEQHYVTCTRYLSKVKRWPGDNVHIGTFDSRDEAQAAGDRFIVTGEVPPRKRTGPVGGFVRVGNRISYDPADVERRQSERRASESSRISAFQRRQRAEKAEAEGKAPKPKREAQPRAHVGPARREIMPPADRIAMMKRIWRGLE